MDKEILKEITVLYVEDELEIADAYAKAIERRVKKLYRAYNGEEGLELFRQNAPDMIVTDINMPKMNGLEMTKKIKNINPKTPVIITSAHGKSANLLEAIDIGVNGYLLKPIDRKKLFELMENFSKIILYDREVELKAYTDTLTKIDNREKFEMAFSRLFSKQQNSQMPLSLMILDIDHFKNFNDTYGHQIGDEILKEFSKRISGHIRKEDIFARWGGEEFVVLTTAPIEYISVMASNLKQEISKDPFLGKYDVRCSIGVTSMLECDTMEIFLKRADDALYRAKRTGRDKVEIL